MQRPGAEHRAGVRLMGPGTQLLIAAMGLGLSTLLGLALWGSTR